MSELDKLKIVRVLYKDLTEHQRITTEELETKGCKQLEIYGRLYSRDDNQIKIIKELDLSKEVEDTEHQMMVIPSTDVITVWVLKEARRMSV